MYHFQLALIHNLLARHTTHLAWFFTTDLLFKSLVLKRVGLPLQDLQAFFYASHFLVWLIYKK